MGVPLLDLKAQYKTIKTETDEAVQQVFESQYFILGPTVVEFEKSIANYCHTNHAIGVSSGTDALLLSLMAAGIGAGDEVITTTYSFFATAGSIARSGAKPVLVDIDPVTFNIDPNLIEAAITPKTRAIMPVHLYGQMADMDAIMAIAEKHNLVVIEDGAQAIGSEYKGKRAGEIGHYGCFSFFPSKNLGGAGDGGMVVANDDTIAERVRIMRVHGGERQYYHSVIGGNFRLDALQAAVLQVKLKYLDQWTEGRQKNAHTYGELFRAAGVVKEATKAEDITSLKDTNALILPIEAGDVRHIYNQFIIRVDRRDELKAFLDERKIGNAIYYPVPFHMQECFADLGYKEGDFPLSEIAAAETLALPVYPELTDDQIKEVADAIIEFLQG